MIVLRITTRGRESCLLAFARTSYVLWECTPDFLPDPLGPDKNRTTTLRLVTEASLINMEGFLSACKHTGPNPKRSLVVQCTLGSCFQVLVILAHCMHPPTFYQSMTYNCKETQAPHQIAKTHAPPPMGVVSC